MITCPACALELPSPSRFCPRCGAAFPLNSIPVYFNPDAHLEGIGGWLLLMAFGLAIAPIAVAGNAVRSLHTLSGRDGAIIFGFSSFLLLRSVASFVALLLLNWLFYTRKSVFPRAMLGYYVWIIGSRLLAALFLSAAPEGRRALPLLLIFPIINAAIWVPYLLVSHRVKATFVN